jgi:hypothetical protein
MPYAAIPRPGLNEFLGEVVGTLRGKKAEEKIQKPNQA